MMDGIGLRETPKKLIYALMGLLLVYATLRCLVAAATKPFWYDELLTLIISSQGTWKGIMSALRAPLDAQPPLFYVIENFASHLLHNQEIALRLPSILALPCTLVCVFIYAKKQSGEVVAFLCSLSLLLTNVFHRYAVEARSYDLVVACMAFALVCYQRAPAPTWVAMLALALALGEALHYYAVFSMIPFGLAECAYSLKKRGFRWRVWAALAFGTLPLVLARPLLSNIRTYYGAHFWGHYSLSAIPETYGNLLLTGAAYGSASVAVCFGGVIATRLLPAKLFGGENESDRDPVEGTLLLMFVAVPLTTYVLTKVLHGAMQDRYVLPTVLGFALALGSILRLARQRGTLLAALFILSAVGFHELSFWRSVHSFSFDNPAQPAEDLVQKAGYPDLLVVVSNGLTYVQLTHYESPAWKQRFVFPVDEQKELQYVGTDSMDKNLKILRLYLPQPMPDLTEFSRSNRTFLLYLEEPVHGSDWLFRYLPSVSSMQIILSEGSRRIYLVNMKEGVPR